MNISRKIALIGALCITAVYEVILFTAVIQGAYGSKSLSFFFTYLFSLAAAAPIVIIFIIFARGRSPKRDMLKR